MSGAVLMAIAASVGNMIQGWDKACIAGVVLYIKKEFNLQSEPTIEGLIVAMSLVGATLVTTFSGPVSDRVGRRPMLVISSLFYFIGGLVMLWSPNVYILLLGRFFDGLAIGLAATIVPVGYNLDVSGRSGRVRVKLFTGHADTLGQQILGQC